MDRPRVGRRLADQRNRKGMAHGADAVTRMGAYVESRSSAGARELSGTRDDRLQGRGRGLGTAFSLGKLSASPTECLEKHVSQAPDPVGLHRKLKKFQIF